MLTKVEFENNEDKIKAKMASNVSAALEAMGTKAVNLILYQMRHGYGKPIRYTGNLQRDVTYEVNAEAKTVTVGNTDEVPYAVYVHEGHAGHAILIDEDTDKWITVPGGHTEGRPYIRDALAGSEQHKKLQKVAEAYLKQGFDEST